MEGRKERQPTRTRVRVVPRQNGHDLYGLRPLFGIQKQGGSILLSNPGNHGDNPYKDCPCSVCRARVSSRVLAAERTTMRVPRVMLRLLERGEKNQNSPPLNQFGWLSYGRLMSYRGIDRYGRMRNHWINPGRLYSRRGVVSQISSLSPSSSSILRISARKAKFDYSCASGMTLNLLAKTEVDVYASRCFYFLGC